MQSSSSDAGQGELSLKPAPALTGSDSAHGSSVTLQGGFAAAYAVQSLSAERVKELRSLGMDVIREEFMRRVLRACPIVDTLSIYWERAPEFMLTGQVQDVARKLVFGRRYRVTGEFKDLWLLCYPEDDGIKHLVEHELDRMVGAVTTLLENRSSKT